MARFWAAHRPTVRVMRGTGLSLVRRHRAGASMTAMARTLLIVDDHAGFRAFARALLEAEDGESALAAVAALDPEVVLLDVALPDIDGFAVCARLLALDRDRPAVVLTSSRDASSYGQRLAGSGARGFVPKSDLSGSALDALTA